eukprot:jgi/Hompol1/3128/HPOL_006355-RA
MLMARLRSGVPAPAPFLVPFLVPSLGLERRSQARLRAATGSRSQPDAKASECSLCHQRFSLLVRRHHCRRCGDIFCSTCCNRAVRLDQNADFHPAGILCRVCDTCHKDQDSALEAAARSGAAAGTVSISALLRSQSSASSLSGSTQLSQPPPVSRQPRQDDEEYDSFNPDQLPAPNAIPIIRDLKPK